MALQHAEVEGAGFETLEELLERVRPRFDRILAHFRVPAEDAEDLVQEIVLQYLYKRAEIVEPDLWLCGALRRECLLFWRRRRRRIYAAIDQTLLELFEDPSGSAQAQALLRHDVERVLKALPERCQCLLRLRFGLGCDRYEIAARTGYAVSSVNKITKRCMAAFAAQLLTAAPGDAD